MKTLSLGGAVLAALLVASLGSHASAQVTLMSDSFDRVSGTPTENGQVDGEPNPLASTSWGDNDNALGGDILQTYEIGPPIRGGNRHQYVDGDFARFRAGWSEIQYDFASDPRVLAGGGLVIEFDAVVASLSNGWLALAVGQSADESTDTGDNSSVFLMVEDTVDFGVLLGGINGNGVETSLEIYEGDDFPEAFTPALSGDWGFGISANDKQRFRVEIASDGFGVDQATATANIFVTHPTFGQRQVLTDYSFDWDADGEVYVAFSSNKDQGCGSGCEDPDQEARIDNLVIRTISTPVLGDGDYNNDGRVDAADYTVWRDTEGLNVTPLSGADGDGNGVVGPGDYTLWASRYGDTIPQAAAVPEPAAAVALLITLGGVAARLRR